VPQVADLYARVGLDVRDLEQGVDRAHGTLQGLAGSFHNIAARAASVAAGFIIRDIVVGSYQRFRDVLTNRQWQTFQAQFEVQLGSQEAAMRRIQELREFSIIAPGTLEDLMQADIIMQNYGLHAANAAQRWGYAGDEIRWIAAEVASGTVASFEEISMWLGRFAMGDTARAIRRFEELGVVSRRELRAMGIEFSNTGEVVTDVDEALGILLRSMEGKFGGMMEAFHRSVGGMEEELADWIYKQKQLWGEPVTEAYQEHLRGLLDFLDNEAVEEMIELGREMWAAGVGWLSEMVDDWIAHFGELTARAFEFGADFMREYAAGLADVSPIARAMTNMAMALRDWLVTRSPPRIAPELDQWGADAAAVYWAGWAQADPDIGYWMQDAMRSLEPHLRDIREAGGLTEGILTGFRGAFGTEASRFEGYVRAYGRLVEAAEETAEAQEAYNLALEEGDEEALAAAEARLEQAQAEERQAMRQLAMEQSRVAQRMSDEARLAQAIEERTRAELRAIQEVSDREAEAEARRIAQARLRYELAVAQTPEAQLEIWRRELAGIEEGTAEWYDTMTQIVRLEQQIARAAETGAGGAAGMADAWSDAMDEVSDEAHDAMEETRSELLQAWDDLREAFEGEGESLAGALFGGFAAWIKAQAKEQLGIIVTKIEEWVPTVEDDVFGSGEFIANFLVDGIRALFGYDKARADTADSLGAHLADAVFRVGAQAWQLGMMLGDGVIFGLTARLLSWVPGIDVDAAEIAAAWEMGMRGFAEPEAGVGAALWAKVFDAEDLAVNIANQWLAVADDPNVSPAIRRAAEEQAERWITDYDLKVREDLGVMTKEQFNELALDDGVIGVIEDAGEAAGEAYGQSFGERALDYIGDALREADRLLKGFLFRSEEQLDQGPPPPPFPATPGGVEGYEIHIENSFYGPADPDDVQDAVVDGLRRGGVSRP